MDNKLLPKSLFGILLTFITLLFLIFALVTGSMTWADSKAKHEAAIENSVIKATKLYQSGKQDHTVSPAGVRPAPPHLQRRIRELGASSNEDLRLFLNPRTPGEFWIKVNDEAWFPIKTDQVPLLWARTFLPKLALIIALIALSALFLSHYIKAPLGKLTLALAQFKRNHVAPKIEPTGPIELQNVTKQVADMMHEISEFESQRELVLAGVAHDIRTPLSRIRIALEMIPQLADDKRNALVSDIEQINYLQSQFLAYTQNDNGESTQKVDVNGLVSGCTGHFATEDIVLNLTEQQIIVEAVPEQLKRAITNILRNADTYGKPPIEISVTEEHKMAVISIKDQGEGVPEELLSKLTQPLYRGEKARCGCEGAGLGLSIVQRCVLSSNGKLELSNGVGAGLQVVIKLPIAN